MQGRLRSFTILLVLTGLLASAGGQNLCLALHAGGMDCCKRDSHCSSAGIKASDCCRFSPAGPAQSPAAMEESTVSRGGVRGAARFLPIDSTGSIPSMLLADSALRWAFPGEVDSGPSVPSFLLNPSLRR